MVKDTIKKSAIDGLISKSSSRKSSNIVDSGKKQTSNVSLKTTIANQSSKKNNSENFGGKMGSAVGTGQTTTNFATPNSTNYDKKYAANSFGEKAGSSKNRGFSSMVSQPKPVAEKKYVSSSYMDPKNKKSSFTFGIIWLPTKRRNKLKDNLQNSDRRDRSRERTPSMYKFLSEGSSNQIEANKEQDLFAPGTLKMTAPIYIGNKTDGPSLDQNNLGDYDKYVDDDEHQGNEEAGVSDTKSINGAQEDINQEPIANKPQYKGEDVVDKVNPCHLQSMSKEQTADSAMEKEDCIVLPN